MASGGLVINWSPCYTLICLTEPPSRICKVGGMVKKRPCSASSRKQPSTATAPISPPTIHEACLVEEGGVKKGASITQAQAEKRRTLGQDVVVCRPDLAANRALAKTIERNANGSWKLCPPHANAGPHALPHCQPDPRPPAGHTFYETPNRKAI